MVMSVAMVGVGWLTGCSRKEIRKPIQGTVTLDGQPPVGKAMINFRPLSGNEANSSGALLASGGSFTIPAHKGLVPGRYAVTIQLWKDTGRTTTDPKTGEAFTVWEPVAFEEANTLVATVTADGVNRFDFRLTRKH